ncbi:hypothetical protein ACFODT_15195 [Vibrio zhugei]|uniref:Uncharacterized protein n=1 Tax=Vibrio zhugei TaxID=2479546 RepID=A0ABV7CCM1_9VIBR|nr:hypothetical protein [Vibrio zhugei]
MIDKVPEVSLYVFLLTFFPWMMLLIYLSIKFRKNKYALIYSISDSAPDRFRERSKMMMESNLSWLAASCFAFEIFGYVMLRYAWKISHSDIYLWRKSIKSILGKDFPPYFIMTCFMDISLASLSIVLISLLFR